MIYTVIWRKSAEDALATLWSESMDKDNVAKAADAIDIILRSIPRTAGESRSGITRVLVIPPLAIFYDVSEPDRFVSVWAVWQLREKG